LIIGAEFARGETVNEKPRILIVGDTPANIKVLHNVLREN